MTDTTTTTNAFPDAHGGQVSVELHVPGNDHRSLILIGDEIALPLTVAADLARHILALTDAAEPSW
jgi:hypothetical protein